ncbi:peptidoglycan-associated lipoprotein Pal [Paracraurococcus lichenis]|uniref:Peptidoglycan-associated lipoprotein n=1 Tax=Paracraurococcus lichenis TaxID=3064888 RepID=A0ABT9DV65_9PROT|nr:peptidoglycan-associated lipoprotein Pal [Paracraurococcus sp. LOR1-02]MDO9707795.1 peptidoglycan-associated lipoprotein Pal [Paracraurococcus sp. LOR1-02]
MKTTRVLGAFAALALLAACESSTDTAATGTGAATTGSTIRPGSQEDLIAQAGSDRVFFDYDSSAIRADQRPTLQRQASWMGANPAVTVQVEGHADERGTREYNLALGQRRANAARDALAAGGVAGGRISTISYGKDRPAALGSNEDAWAQNRRAVTVVR